MTPVMKLQAAVVTLLLLGTVPVCVAGDAMTSRYLDQPVLVFRSDDISNKRIPARIHKHRVPVVFGSQVILACLAVNPGRGELIAYLPKSQSCIPLNDMTLHAGTPDLSLESLKGLQRDRAELQKSLKKSTVVVMQPQVNAGASAGLCSCPGNQPPEVTVRSGSPQIAIAGAGIETIDYVATDVDSEVLTENFSYTLEGGNTQLGLPAGLVEDCAPGVGTLTCTVGGTAPATTGVYLITMDVIDGFNLSSATALLTVISEQVFSDGFEDGL